MRTRHTRAPAILTTILTSLALATTPCLASADLQGIDVSSWQPSDITERVTADFAIVKTTQGTGYVNPHANAQLAAAQRTGKETGVYHYAGGGDCNQEADYFLQHSAGYIRKSVLVLDWESNQNSAWGNANWPTCFVNRVKARTNGVIPMVYVQASSLWQVEGARNAGAGLWVAQYASNTPTGYQAHPWKLGAYGEAMRQYTASGILPGYSGYLDLNIFRGDRIAWRKYADPATTSTTTKPSTTQQKPPTPQPQQVDWDALATAVIRGEYGNLPQRRVNITTAYGTDAYDRVQTLVNKRLGATHTQPVSRSTSVVVRSGDTMSGIAARTGLYPLSAWSVPSGNINRIWPGQVVTYRGTTTGGTGSRTVTVRAGDTLTGIAARLGISTNQISGYHSGNPNLIYPGETLHY